MHDQDTGTLLRRLRLERGWTQRQVAEQLGVSTQAVSKWELNTAQPDTDKLIPLARALGVSVDKLLGNGTENKGGEVPPPKAFPGPPGWLAAHWYWLGLVLMAVGLYQLIQLLPGISSIAAVGGVRVMFGFLLMLGLAPMAAVIAGLLIFFLGRRHVRKKYGREP